MNSNPKMSVSGETVTISIAKDLYDKVQKRVNSSNEEFKSVEDYITFLLTEVVREEDQEKITADDNAYTKEEEEEIKGRLKNLGYI